MLKQTGHGHRIHLTKQEHINRTLENWGETWQKRRKLHETPLKWNIAENNIRETTYT